MFAKKEFKRNKTYRNNPKKLEEPVKPNEIGFEQTAWKQNRWKPTCIHEKRRRNRMKSNLNVIYLYFRKFRLFIRFKFFFIFFSAFWHIRIYLSRVDLFWQRFRPICVVIFDLFGVIVARLFSLCCFGIVDSSVMLWHKHYELHICRRIICALQMAYIAICFNNKCLSMCRSVESCVGNGNIQQHEK